MRIPLPESIIKKQRNIRIDKMIRSKKSVALVVLIFSLISSLSAQRLSTNKWNLNEYYRREQLLGKVDSSLSFTLRPLSQEALKRENLYDPDSSLEQLRSHTFNARIQFHKQRGRLEILPVSMLTQYNSELPEGLNDGLMVPARGLQTRWDAGFFFKYSLLEITMNPEFVWAQNHAFKGFPAGYTTTWGIDFPQSPYAGRIDLPERFGDDYYSKITWGQSSVRLVYKSISLGISNENLWWGPGYKNSLLMTNSAAGFKHLTLNTVRPIKTFIGTFEGQIIGGRLEASGYTEGLRDDWRYMNAISLSYNPKWIKGLFLGLNRSFLVYNEDMGNSLNDYLPVLSFLSKKAAASGGTNEDVDAKNQNQIISVFMRWLFPKAKGEVYFEYGREDHSWDSRDFLLEPAHSAAYMLGFRKLVSLGSMKKSHLQIIGELTHLASSLTTINRAIAGNKGGTPSWYGGWYLHSKVRHGYTQEGQMLGAGIGPASNMQTIHISWNRGLKQIGVEFDRYVHNNDFWHIYIKDIRSNWVDKSTAVFANWDYKHFLLFAKMKFVNVRNYQWLYEPVPDPENPQFWMPEKNTLNFQSQIGVSYRF